MLNLYPTKNRPSKAGFFTFISGASLARQYYPRDASLAFLQQLMCKKGLFDRRHSLVRQHPV